MKSTPLSNPIDAQQPPRRRTRRSSGANGHHVPTVAALPFLSSPIHDTVHDTAHSPSPDEIQPETKQRIDIVGPSTTTHTKQASPELDDSESESQDAAARDSAEATSAPIIAQPVVESVLDSPRPATTSPAASKPAVTPTPAASSHQQWIYGLGGALVALLIASTIGSRLSPRDTSAPPVIRASSELTPARQRETSSGEALPNPVNAPQEYVALPASEPPAALGTWELEEPASASPLPTTAPSPEPSVTGLSGAAMAPTPRLAQRPAGAAHESLPQPATLGIPSAASSESDYPVTEYPAVLPSAVRSANSSVDGSANADSASLDGNIEPFSKQ